MPRTRLFVLLALLPWLLACQRAEPPSGPRVPSKLIIPSYQDLAPVNPLATTTLSTRLVELVLDGLTRIDDRLEVQPQLARQWQVSDDHRTWTFFLRHGVRFHDGAELAAEDVKRTYEWLGHLPVESAYSDAFTQIDRVVVRDRYTVEVTLREPMASFLDDLTVGILPARLLDARNFMTADFHTPLVGTGPFKLRQQSAREIVLDANDDYYLGRPSLDQIVVTVYPSQESAWAGLLRGEVNFFPVLDPVSYGLLARVSTVTQYAALKPYYYLLMFNSSRPLFRDRRVRQALNYAVDKDGLIAGVLKGRGRAASGTIYPNSWAYEPSVRPYPYDPRMALRLLGQAGWVRRGDRLVGTDGRPFIFTVYTNRGDDLKQRTLLLVQQQLRDLGITMHVELSEGADQAFLFQRRFDAIFAEVDAGGDPDLSYKFWHSSQIDRGMNFGSYRNAAVDHLLEEGRRTFDRDRRRTIYGRFQRVIHDDPPGIFLFWTDYLVGVDKEIRGVQIGAVGPFANIREWTIGRNQGRNP